MSLYTKTIETVDGVVWKEALSCQQSLLPPSGQCLPSFLAITRLSHDRWFLKPYSEDSAFVYAVSFTGFLFLYLQRLAPAGGRALTLTAAQQRTPRSKSKQ